jgi:hypothetical protein
MYMDRHARRERRIDGVPSARPGFGEGFVETWGWWTLAGLVADIVGAAVLAAGLIVSKERDIELGASRLAGETDDENLRLPAVSDRLMHARWAVIALVLLVLGFGLQAIGALLSAAG